MKAIVQRVLSASVSIAEEEVGSCGKGLLVLVAAHREDSEKSVVALSEKLIKLRIFNDEDGKMNLALKDLPAQREPKLLVISNFTVYGDCKGQNRPSFIESAPYEKGKELFDFLLQSLRERGFPAETGVFGADMQVALVNDGPVTVIVET